MAAGRALFKANDGKVATVTFEDGAVDNVGVVVPKEGGTLATENYVANIGQRKNYLINGNFDMWQYGTSQTTSGYGSADRWYNWGATSLSQSSDVPTQNIKYSIKKVSSTSASGSFYTIEQKVENERLLAGKTVTLSFWIKGSVPGNIVYRSYSQSNNVGVNHTLISLTTNWVKKSITFTVPSVGAGTKDWYAVAFDTYVNNVPALNYSGSGVTEPTYIGDVYIAQVKLEDGSVATDGWHPYDGEFGGEVQACQRYLPVIKAGTPMAGYCINTVQAYISVPFSVPTRTVPTGVTAASPSGTFWNTTGGAITGTALSSGNHYSSNGAMLAPSCAAGLVAGQGTMYKSSSDILFTGCEL